LVLEQHAKAIALIDPSNGLYVAENIKESLFNESQLILGIYANAPQEELRSALPNQIKIASLGEIKDMVSRGVSRLNVRTLPTAPRQIPYHANYIYFEIDQHNEYWQTILESNSLCIHIGAHYQDLRMELWSIHS
jgi:type VI secretion system protein ImpJ